jgi:hypothetical protein
MENTITRILKDEGYRVSIIDSLCAGIDRKWIPDFIEMIEWVIERKFSEIENLPILQRQFYEGEDDTLELILPAIRRVWAKVFITPPQLLVGRRLELFQLLFNINDFIDYLVEMLESTRGSLEKFIYLDKCVETLTLIVDNYIAKLIHDVTTCEDQSSEIRDLKINKLME